MRRKLLLCFIFLFSGVGLSLEKPHHLRVIWHEKPSTSAVISWSSVTIGTSEVYFDTLPRFGDLSQYRFKVKANSLPMIDKDARKKNLPQINHGHLNQLTPNTPYYFSVVTDGKVSQEYWFHTAPQSGDFHLLFGGDSRSDWQQRRRMNRMMRRMFEQDPSILALVHGGDFVGNGSDWRHWDAWLKDHQETITANRRILPVIPTRGNHENDASLFNLIWSWPGKGNVYYRSDIANLSLLILNTEISVLGDQFAWLESELKQLAKGERWFIPNYHRPAFPAVKRPSQASKWTRLFEDYQVDLVFESDGHVLKKTVPIYRGKHDQKRGITYLGEGGLGVKQRKPKNYWYLQGEGFARSAHHVLKLKVTENQLVVEAIGKDMQPIFSHKKIRNKRFKVDSPADLHSPAVHSVLR